MIVYQTDGRFGWCHICKAEEVHKVHKFENEHTEKCERCGTVTDCNSIQCAMNVCHGKEIFKTSNDIARRMVIKIKGLIAFDEDQEDWDIQNKQVIGRDGQAG